MAGRTIRSRATSLPKRPCANYPRLQAADRPHCCHGRDATSGMTAGSKQYGMKNQMAIDMPEEVTCILEKYRPRLFLSGHGNDLV